MVLLARGSRRCLHSCCMGTLCLQLLLWILCAVKGESQTFSVEVRKFVGEKKYIFGGKTLQRIRDAL